MTEVKSDSVNHPKHYTVGGMEVIEIIKAKLTPEEFRGFLKGNRMKYCLRSGHKDDEVQDIEKEIWYGNTMIDYLKGTIRSSESKSGTGG